MSYFGRYFGIDGDTESFIGILYFNGSTWIPKPLKYWNGSSFVTVTTLKYWNGSSWISI